LNSEDILSLAPPPADQRLHYGSDPNQFADLRRPTGKGPHPVAVFLHGGFWRAKYDLAHAGHVCAALTAAGIATWNLEYRRLGNAGGGWPGTFEDITNGFRFVSQIAKRFALALDRLLVMGHSAGGQLAFALAAHQPSIRRAVSLAGVLDLRRAWELHLSHDAAAEFLGGSPQQVPEHYHEASPLELPLSHADQVLVHGAEDDIVPVSFSRTYFDIKTKRGEKVDLLEHPKAGHFDLIDPRSSAWPAIQDKILKLLA
jgi:acetyl esterase/lipase